MSNSHITRGEIGIVRATYLYTRKPTGVTERGIRGVAEVNECAIAKALERSETSGDMRYAMKLNN